MQNKTKFSVLAGVVVIGTALSIRKEWRIRTEKRIYSQINQRFANQNIYGTWLAPKYMLLSENYYLGGINILDQNTIVQYQFRANQNGIITSLYHAGSQPATRF
ncbi:hypothetical protein [Nicoliella lavandulae]|uniref:Uncharacterized protein n=1 Tax=Nicoliella lavandulae TaxID=3082954 RepID=A0ABU8SKQ5_9LACO